MSSRAVSCLGRANRGHTLWRLMRILLTGGTGLLGRPLSAALARYGHQVTVLTRSRLREGGQAESGAEAINYVQWSPDQPSRDWEQALDGTHIVINLVGESIGGKRWSEAQKQKLYDTRVLTTRKLVEAFGRMTQRPRLLLSGSGVNFYGSRGDELLTEASQPGDDFLSRLCIDWEQAANDAARDGTRVIIVRTSLVLAREGGALQQIAQPFKFFVGGPVGSGRQYMSWIHRSDWIALVMWLITQDHDGAFNATSPHPVMNETFSAALGRAMRRPSLVPAPAFALRLIAGEMADTLLLSSQRAVPARALEHGFDFNYPTIERAFDEIYVSQRT